MSALTTTMSTAPSPAAGPAWIRSPLHRKTVEEYEAMVAAGAIPVYWIVDLVDRRVEGDSDPGPGGHATRRNDLPGDVIPVSIGGRPIGPIAVDDILP